jgi:hypothetical protein
VKGVDGCATTCCFKCAKINHARTVSGIGIVCGAERVVCALREDCKNKKIDFEHRTACTMYTLGAV